jgi:hypothetical protein
LLLGRIKAVPEIAVSECFELIHAHGSFIVVSAGESTVNSGGEMMTATVSFETGGGSQTSDDVAPPDEPPKIDRYGDAQLEGGRSALYERLYFWSVLSRRSPSRKSCSLGKTAGNGAMGEIEPPTRGFSIPAEF